MTDSFLKAGIPSKILPILNNTPVYNMQFLKEGIPSKILPILNNTPVYPPQTDEDIKVACIPSNITTLIQLMDQHYVKDIVLSRCLFKPTINQCGQKSFYITSRISRQLAESWWWDSWLGILKKKSALNVL